MHGEVPDLHRLSPRMILVVLGGEGLDGFETTEFTDQYVNALFVPDGATYAAPFDVDQAAPPAAAPPARAPLHDPSWDADNRLVSIDFVVHGDVGPPGDGRTTPDRRPPAVRRPDRRLPAEHAGDWHLMVGDESALPAIAASLERVRDGVPVSSSPSSTMPTTSCGRQPGALRLALGPSRRRPGQPRPAPRRRQGVDFPAGVADVFVHGEAGETRAVRSHLFVDPGDPP